MMVQKSMKTNIHEISYLHRIHEKLLLCINQRHCNISKFKVYGDNIAYFVTEIYVDIPRITHLIKSYIHSLPPIA